MSNQGSSSNKHLALRSFLVPGWGQLMQERHRAAIVQFAIAVVVWYYLLVEMQIGFLLALPGAFLIHGYSLADSRDFVPPNENRKISSTPPKAPTHQQATPTHQQASPARRQAKPVSRRAKPVPQSAALPIDQDPTRFTRTPPTEDDLDDEWRDYSEAEMIAAVEEFYASGIVINPYGDVVHDLTDEEIAEYLSYNIDSDGNDLDSGGSGGGHSDSGDFY